MNLRRMLGCAFAIALAATGAAASALAPIPLRPDDRMPAAEESVRLTEQGEHIVSNVRRPSITPYLPQNAGGAAVIVIPGGGHRELWMDHEGYRVGQFLADRGVAAFVLKYRLSRAEGSPYTMQDELADVQQAIRLVRARAAEWHVSPNRIGVIGFSAGGELAILAGTQSGGDSDRPDFIALIYPAIPKDLHIGKDTPPAFLLCGAADSPEIAEGVPSLFLALKRAGGSAEMHVLAGAGHGFGLRDTNPAGVAIWPQLFSNWLQTIGMTKAP
jgi:endo-1,4-beta-xylanase